MTYHDRTDKRCIGRKEDGSQCTNRTRDEDCDYCANCYGKQAIRTKTKERQRMYDLGQYDGDVQRFANHAALKGLKEEIGISRMLLERILKTIDPSNPAELLGRFPQVNQSIKTIADLVSQCNKFDIASGQMLDKTDVSRISTSIVEIIASEIDDQAVLGRIATRIATLFDSEEGNWW